MQITGIQFLKRLKINAIVIYPFIIYSDKKIDPIIANHERIHWDQIKRDGVIKFYALYLQEYYRLRRKGLTHHAAYRGISYEKEAYLHEEDFSYQINRTHKSVLT
ncbi:MAG TPA: hypothetical protein VNJ08_07780 [Bacteriovoracaceae bacterium]|nr:hypothetical protein [Bacteriovoracaceae bacterium]